MTPSDFPSFLGQPMTSYYHPQISAVGESYQTLNAVPALENMFFLAALQLCHKEDTDGATTLSSEKWPTGWNKKGKRSAVAHRDNT
ncbi:hypothetical protein DPMN_176487 [Dreissena polymorpha]|uniref:Uncharacterized protein n=1 Tax=Dreissena polymorpha TaxID=45954 RepID=A0A9D4E9K8_DREPO|nr:hypothetical protein DPMN_176487 [Dreissena polymorpha]